MMYDQFGVDRQSISPTIDSIVDYAYNNFSDWYPDPEYFFDSDYEEKIALLEQNLDELADYIYDYGEKNGLVRDMGMDVDVIYHSVALDLESRKEITKQLVDRFYKSPEGTVSKTAGTWALDEKAAHEFRLELEKLRDHYFELIGSDELYDYIDGAISTLGDMEIESERKEGMEV